MLTNAIEMKKTFAVIYATNREDTAVKIKVSLEQLELLHQIKGRVIINNYGVAYVLATNGNRATLKAVFYGFEDVEYLNGNKYDLRPENVKVKQFDFNKLLEVN